MTNKLSTTSVLLLNTGDGKPKTEERLRVLLLFGSIRSVRILVFVTHIWKGEFRL